MSLELDLKFDPNLVNKYSKYINYDITTIPEDNRTEVMEMYKAMIMVLKSKQSNEKYEELLTELFKLTLNSGKHGWDGWDGESIETSDNLYEMKPIGSGSAFINDDSLNKIEKNVCNNNKKGWLVLAIIDRGTYSFSKIYKFPIEIYHESRIEYVNGIKKKNSEKKDGQTRATYSITVGKSINLCKKYNKEYYVWKR